VPIEAMAERMIMVFVALTLTMSVVNALQQHHNHLEKSLQPYALSDMVFVEMDQSETDIRGSYCLDGAVPGFYYRKGPNAPKQWILAFQGGTWCQTVDDCVKKIENGQTIHGPSGAPGGIDSHETDFSIFKTANFHEYNHVVFHHCDAGLWMGDREDPIQARGHTMYLRGKRILDHIIDYLKTNTSFGEATDVMITGGSGGGQATFLVSDYLTTLFPSTVTKYGALPIDGWWASQEPSQEAGFELHNMKSTIAPACAAAGMGHNCLYSDIAYKYSKTPMFIIQLIGERDIQGRGEFIHEAWSDCLFEDKTCPTGGVSSLQDYIDGVVSTVQSTPKYSKLNEGGFISTCTKHIVFLEDGYFNYESGGVTMEHAVQNWWNNLDSPSAVAKWYLPCELNAEFPHQCEDTCDDGE